MGISCINYIDHRDLFIGIIAVNLVISAFSVCPPSNPLGNTVLAVLEVPGTIAIQVVTIRTDLSTILKVNGVPDTSLKLSPSYRTSTIQISRKLSLDKSITNVDVVDDPGNFINLVNLVNSPVVVILGNISPILLQVDIIDGEEIHCICLLFTNGSCVVNAVTRVGDTATWWGPRLITHSDGKETLTALDSLSSVITRERINLDLDLLKRLGGVMVDHPITGLEPSFALFSFGLGGLESSESVVDKESRQGGMR